MLRFAIRRLLTAVPVLVLVSLLSFAVIFLLPGAPASAFALAVAADVAGWPCDM